MHGKQFRRLGRRGYIAAHCVLAGLMILAIGGGVFARTTHAGAVSPASVASVASGAWSDPNTWAGGQLPGATTAVTIATGTLVVLDESTSVAGAVVNGDLVFDPTRSIDLFSDHNVIVNGSLTMIPSSAAQVHRLRFVGVDNSKFVGGGMNPLPTDVGLWVMGSGRLDLQGAAKTAWLPLAGGLAAGVSSGIKLASTPVGWNPGDSVFIAPTQAPTAGTASYLGFESTTLAQVAGNTIAISNPALRAHPMVNGKWTAEIGNLTRNVRIEGTATGYSHVFIRSTSPQTIRYAALTYLGTDKVLGRYPLHFHFDGEGSRGTVVQGVVVQKSLNHAFVPHASNGITFTDTIAYQIGNAAYWWDPNTSTSSSNNGSSAIVFDHAIAANVYSTSETGTRLAAFRMGEGVSLSNTVRNSVAVGVQGAGESAGFQWISGGNAWNFTNNVAHNEKGIGIYVWQNDHENQVVNGFTEYYSQNGIVQGAYKNQYHYNDVTLYGNNKTGITLYATARENGIVFDRLHIDGAGLTQIGVLSCCHLPGTNSDPTTLSNCSVDHTLFGSVWMGAGRPGANTVRVTSCTLGAKPFYFQAGAPVGATIEYRSGTQRFALTIAKSGTGAIFVPAWNAWRHAIS